MDESRARMASSEDGDTIVLSASADVRQTEGAPAENPFSCNVCKRSYTRVDHLARHYRSHTKEKPYDCEICGKSFARIDLLKRHAASHTDESPNKRQKTSQRASHSRVSQACIACAEAKLRCEGSSPCGRCQRKGIACEFAQPRSRRTANFSQPRYDSNQGSHRDSEASNVLQMVESGTSDPNQNPNTVMTHLNQDPILAMNSSRLPGDQTGIEAGPGQQVIFDHNQLPTPTTFDQGSAIMPLEPSFYETDPMMTTEDLSLIDFLRDVMTPTPLHASMRHNGSDTMQSFPRDLLDFNVETTFDLPSTYAMPYPFVAEQQFQPYPATRIEAEDHSGSKSGFTTPGVPRSISLGTQAFKDSIWLWTPAQEDHGFAEQHNLSLPYESVVSPAEGIDDSFPREQLKQSARDRVLAMVLSTCDCAIFPRVVACFPSAELLTNLIHNYISFHVHQDISWIHPATLKINEESADFLASLICSGATISRVPELRKLGFAIQEAVRLSLPESFEKDNRSTRKLRPLQAFASQLDVGLWSGDRRKMEISESFSHPLVTMVRRAGHFRRSRFPEFAPQAGDDAKTIETKWHGWVEAESFKRLALSLFARDTRSSMSLLNQPLISYAELSADLPFAKDLWLAKTATEWKDLYRARCHEMNDRLPSVRTCVDDTSPIFKYQHVVDVQMTLVVILSSIWALIWQYREMKTTVKFNSKGGFRNSGLTANSLHQEISKSMQHLGLNVTEWDEGMKPPARMLYEQCLMHLHVSLEDVQLLAGKDGEDEARKAFPVLTAWAESPESRQAIFHAGQVLRAAKQYRGYMLRDASAVAVYHASLALWAYSVLSKSLNNSEEARQQSQPRSVTGYHKSRNFVRLDGEDNAELQRFLVLGKGVPSITRWVEGEDSSVMHDVPLRDPIAVMTAITSLLWKKNGDDEKSCPPLVVNLSKLMKALGNAAAGMRRK